MSNNQKLVKSIIDFLNKSIQDGTVKQDDAEGLEVAIQCIAEAFGVDPLNSEQAEQLSIKPASLQTIFDVFVKTQAKVGGSAAATNPSTTPKVASAEEKAEAEKLKQAGNALMFNKKYDAAIESYTKAIAVDAFNPVYYSNRAAAHVSKGDHSSAVQDAEKAIEVDPSFVKAYSRLGHAQYTLGDYSAAALAFRRGLELDPSNANLKSGLANSEERISEDVSGPPSLIPDDSTQSRSAPSAGGMPDLSRMADMMRGMGGSGGGGMPDLSSLLNNPALMEMANNMMANGGLENLMSNPAVSNMMNRMQSGGGMPDMNDLMQDPALRNLANQFGGGGAGR